MNDTVHKSPDEYGDDFHAHLLEQYKIVRGRIVDVINDRNTQNKFLLAVLTVILAVPAVLLRNHSWSDGLPITLAMLVLPFPLLGAVISWHWIQWNKTFDEALGADYKILKAMEVHLPAQPFTVENELRQELGKGVHKKTTDFTVKTAQIFLAFNVLLFIGVVTAVVCSC